MLPKQHPPRFVFHDALDWRKRKVRANHRARYRVMEAPAEELMTLPGIGEKRAADIIADREANGPFRIPEDLTRVSGIGEGILEGLIDLVTVS